MSSTKQWFIFLICALAVFMVDVDITAVNLVLSNIASALHSSISTMQWIINGYMMAAAALMAFGGRLADLIGYRRVFLFGLLAFGLASTGVAYSHTVIELIIFRIFQGASIAFTFPISIVVLRFIFPENKQGFVMGSMVAIAGLSQAIGPSFGAVMLHAFGWRSIFLVNIPLSAFALISAYFLLPKPDITSNKTSIQAGPIALFAVGLLVLMYALNSVGEWGLMSLPFFGCLAFSLITLALFALIEHRSTNPVLNLNLFALRTFRHAQLIRFALSFIYFGLLLVLGLLLQNILHYSSIKAGGFMLFMTLMIGVLSIPAGKAVDHWGAKKPLALGISLMLVGLLSLACFTAHPSVPLLITALCLLGGSFALTIPSSASSVMMSVKPAEAGAANGLFFTTSFIAGSIGTAVSSAILVYVSEQHVINLLKAAHYSLSAKQTSVVLAASHGAGVLGHHRHLFEGFSMKLLSHISSDAFLHALFVLMGLSVLLGALALAGTSQLDYSSEEK